MPLHLDHIVILIPHAQLLNLPAWIPKHFTITPGGVHAGGRTENRLVCFQDGSYIEFISFVSDDPKNREGHCWGDRKYGIIDFAFTSEDADMNWEGVNERLEGGKTGVRYERPREGGRKRPDGVELQWKVTWPVVVGELAVQRGELPFFCHDITPRELRVPLEEENTKHPTFCYGIKTMGIYVPEDRAKLLADAYAAVLDTSNIKEDGEQALGVFEIQRMNKVPGVDDSIRFYVQAPLEEWQKEAMDERGGVMLGDIVVGGLSILGGSGILMRIDIPVEEGMGRIFLDSNLPGAWSRPDEKASEKVEAAKNYGGDGSPEMELKSGERIL